MPTKRASTRIAGVQPEVNSTDNPGLQMHRFAHEYRAWSSRPVPTYGESSLAATRSQSSPKDMTAENDYVDIDTHNYEDDDVRQALSTTNSDASWEQNTFANFAEDLEMADARNTISVDDTNAVVESSSPSALIYNQDAIADQLRSPELARSGEKDIDCHIVGSVCGIYVDGKGVITVMEGHCNPACCNRFKLTLTLDGGILGGLTVTAADGSSRTCDTHHTRSKDRADDGNVADDEGDWTDVDSSDGSESVSGNTAGFAFSADWIDWIHDQVCVVFLGIAILVAIWQMILEILA